MALLAATAMDALTRYWQTAFQQDEQGVDKPGFLAFFGKNNGRDETITITEGTTVNVDIQKSTGQTLAGMLPRGASFVKLDKNVSVGEAFTNEAMQFGLIEEEFKMTSDQDYKRMFGENPFSNMSHVERRHMLANKIFNKIAGKVFRTHSYLASQSILTGKHDQILGTSNTNFLYDFKRSTASYVDATGSEWNTGTPDILLQIDNGCEWIYKYGYGKADMIVFGDGMLDAFIKDTKVKGIGAKDSMTGELIQVSQNLPVPTEYARYVQAGFMPWGRLRTPKGHVLWMFTFKPYYLDPADNSTFKQYMPTDGVLICDSTAQTTRYFGPRDSYEMSQAEIAWYQEMFGMSAGAPVPSLNMRDAGTSLFDPRAMWVDAYSLGNRKGIVCRVQSAPIYAPTNVDAYYTIHDGLV